MLIHSIIVGPGSWCKFQIAKAMINVVIQCVYVRPVVRVESVLWNTTHCQIIRRNKEAMKVALPPHLSDNDSKCLIPVRLAKHGKPIF